jgi:hypothetical protein
MESREDFISKRGRDDYAILVQNDTIYGREVMSYCKEVL